MSDLLHALGFIALAGAVFIAIILLEAHYWRRKNRPDVYDLRETLANMSTGALYKVVDGIAIALFIQYCYDYVRGWGLQWSFEHGFAAYALLFLVSDFFYYFYHRAMHSIRWFWAIHVTHHSSQRLNFSTALRQNFLMDLNFGWVLWWLPLALVGFDKTWSLIAIELSLVYQFFLHTEVVRRLGALEWVFNTPSHHRVHHGCKPTQIDTNFGGVLIVWDRFFGTFVDERDAGTIKYGLTQRQPSTLNPLRLNLDEFFQMFKDAWKYRDGRVFVNDPGYVERRYGGAETAAAVESAAQSS